MLKTKKHYQVLKKVSDLVTSWEDLVTMVIWLGRDPGTVERLRNENTRIADATSHILFSFYRSASPTECWATLKGALTQLDKGNYSLELGLDELQAEAENQSGTRYLIGA